MTPQQDNIIAQWTETLPLRRMMRKGLWAGAHNPTLQILDPNYDVLLSEEDLLQEAYLAMVELLLGLPDSVPSEADAVKAIYRRWRAYWTKLKRTS